MKEHILSRIFLVVPLSVASTNFSTAPADAFERAERSGLQSLEVIVAHAANRPKSGVLIAQNDGGDSGIGSITPEKIRAVVELSLRQKWHAPAAAEGSKTIVRFTVTKTGQLAGSPSLSSSAGNPEFDQAGVGAINQIAPLNALPSYLSNIPFIATFHAGKSPWMELKLDEQDGGGGQSNGSSPGSSTGQSGWTQPSGGSSAGDTATAASGQSDWTQPARGSQSDWNDPSVAAMAGQSGWTQPSGSANPPAQAQRGSSDSVELQAQPASLLNAPPRSAQPPNSEHPLPVPVLKQASVPGKTHPAAKDHKPQDHKPPAGSSPQALSHQVNSSQPAKVQYQNPQQSSASTGLPTQTDMSGSQDLSQRVVLLNNNAVVAIADSNYEAAIKKLEEALKIDPTYQQARANLAIAYNNYGLQLKDRPDDAIKVFHKAFALDPGNEKTKINLDTIIQYMGKNARSFKDRLDLGNKAAAQGDRLGARIEYEAALAIKSDPILQQKLSDIINGAPVNSGTPQGQNNTGGQTHSGQPGGPAKTAGHAGKPPTGANVATKKPPEHTQPAGTTDGAQSGVSQKLDTMYRNIKTLEIKTFGKPFESDDVLTRLSRLEQKLLGKVQQGKPMRRLDALLILQ